MISISSSPKVSLRESIAYSDVLSIGSWILSLKVSGRDDDELSVFEKTAATTATWFPNIHTLSLAQCTITTLSFLTIISILTCLFTNAIDQNWTVTDFWCGIILRYRRRRKICNDLKYFEVLFINNFVEKYVELYRLNLRTHIGNSIIDQIRFNFAGRIKSLFGAKMVVADHTRSNSSGAIQWYQIWTIDRSYPSEIQLK